MVYHYATRHELSRSAVFEQVLMRWYEALQEEADKVFYAREREDPEVRSWSKISSQAIGCLWDE